ncbi:MAG: SAM-dependent methyltransferase, partial [Methylophilaceae bacterium 17-43-7]
VSQARFILGNYEKLNFAEYDIVFAYLSPAAMSAIWQKASKEMRPGSMLISLEFDIPDAASPHIIQTGKSTPKLFVWRMA